MRKGLMIRVFLCLSVFSLCLFSYLEKQNEVTQLKLHIPKVAKEIKALHEDNAKWQYEISQLESPENLMELARDSRYSHLRYPLTKDVLTMQQGIALQSPAVDKSQTISIEPKLTLAVGANGQ